MDDRKCTICSSNVNGKYCSNCGQKYGNKPTNALRLILDFLEQGISIQKSDFATMLNVIKRPRFIIDNYYTGNTGYYSSPGKVMLFAILILIVHMTFVSNLILGIDFSAEQLNLEYTFLFLFILLFTLVSQIVFVRKGLAISKHMIASTYVVSTFMTFFTLFYWIVLLIFGDDSIFTFLSFIMSIIIWLSIIFTKNRTFLYFLLNVFLVIGLFLIILLVLSNGFTISTPN